LEPQKRIIDEPLSLIREAARKALKGRMPLAFASALIYMLCVSLPVIIVEQITGLWTFIERATNEYLAQLSGNPNPASIFEWAQSYEGMGGVSLATFFYLLLVPGPLTLGISVIWLQIIRRREAFADMVFSGFGNFLRAMLLNFVRCLLMALWAILFVIPGIIAYYRYSLAFFLIADNPSMPPFYTINLSKYYMQGNKGNRFLLDLSFIGWVCVAYIAYSFGGELITAIIAASGYTVTLFINLLVSCILGSAILSPLFAYRCVAAAEYYHRVTCQDPQSFKDPLKLPVT